MYESILVPLDLGPEDVRSIAVAAVLAEAGSLPVELILVTSAGLDHTADSAMVARRAKALGEVPWSVDLVEGDDVADVLVEHLRGRPGVLPVASTHAWGAMAGRLLGSVSEELVERLDRPIVLVGPRALPPRPPLSLVVAHLVDGGACELDEAVASWRQTFPGELATVLRVADHPVDAVLDAAAGVAGHVLATPLEEARPGVADWDRTSRALVRRADCPVLVVPGRKVASTSGAR